MGKQSRVARRRAVETHVRRRGATERRPRPLFIALGVVGVLLVAGIAVLIVALGGTSPTSGSGSLPSGTQVFSESDHSHVAGAVTYDHVPPAGGAHNAVWLNCGIYTQPVPNENAVHSLEHGAVWITYQPDLAASQVAALQQFVQNSYSGPQRYVLLSPYPNLPSPIVASAWGAQLQLTDPADPRLAEFVSHFRGGAQGGEPGGECTGGTGTPVG